VFAQEPGQKAGAIQFGLYENVRFSNENRQNTNL
jgi:hypothetical protein